MRDGLHQKLLGYGLLPSTLQSLAVNSCVPSGNTSEANGCELAGNFTPFPSTVMPAPSYAPKSVGSINCSARLPFSEASQPTVASRGKRSTWNCISFVQLNVPDGSYGFPAFPPEGAAIGVPLSAKPKRQTACRRQGSSLPAG